MIPTVTWISLRLWTTAWGSLSWVAHRLYAILHARHRVSNSFLSRIWDGVDIALHLLANWLAFTSVLIHGVAL